MILPRPSTLMRVLVKPDEYSDAMAKEIKRSYNFQALVVVQQLDEDDLQDGNVMHLRPMLAKRYWDKNDPAAQELWEGVMPRWVRNMTRNISTAMNNFNNVIHPLGAHNINYDWADYEFCEQAATNMMVRLKLDDHNAMPSSTPKLVDRARDLVCDGAFEGVFPAAVPPADGEDAADDSVKVIDLIRMPSYASFEAQKQQYAEELAQWEKDKAAYDAYQEALKAKEEAEAAQAEAVQVIEADAPVDAEVEEVVADGEAVTTEDAPAVDAYADGEYAETASSEATEDQEDQEDELEPVEDPGPRPVFTIDYSVWGITYVDGTVVEFNSAE